MDLVLLHSADRYDLRRDEERQRSRRELRRLFVAIQAALRPEVGLEIGAYGAEISLALARNRIPMHAFEPNGAKHARCAGAVQGSGLPIRYSAVAVGGSEGLVTFHASTEAAGATADRRAGANSLLPPCRQINGCEAVTVPSVTLAGYLDRHGLADVPFSAAISVGGALGPLFAGAGAAFERCLSALVEVEDRAIWQGQMLAPEAVAALAARGLIPVARDFHRPFQYSLLLLRPEGLRNAEVRLLLAEHLQRGGAG